MTMPLSVPEYIAFFVYIAAALVSFVLAVRYFTHMLQLESYQTPGYARFLKLNAVRRWLLRIMPALVGAGLMFLPNRVICFSLAAFCAVVCAFLFRPVKAKKPFVVTARVKRLFVTVFLLGILTVACAVFFPQTAFVPLILSPLYVLLANLINIPVENAVKQHYINDAKRILASRSGTLTIIGITGSYGKTSTKYFLEKILSQHFEVLKTPGSFNTPMGVVRVIREMLKPSHEIFLCEMGARHEHDIKEICDIVHPDHGIITSVGPQHLETFHDIETVIRTKFELADAVPESGHMVLCGDNEYIASHPRRAGFILYASEGADADVSAENVKATPDGTEFDLVYGDRRVHLFTRLIGRHNLANITGACALAMSLGLSDHELIAGVRKLESVPHRLEMINSGDMTVIDDAFNSNPVGAGAALEVLDTFDGLKVLVTPGMVELGKSAESLNRAFGKKAGEICHIIYIVGKENEQSLAEGISESGFDTEHCLFHAATAAEAVSSVRTIPTPLHKYVLLENDLPDNYR